MKACESSARKTTMAGTGAVSDQSAAATCFIMTCLTYLFRCFRCRHFDASSFLPTTTSLVPVHPPGGKILGSAKRQRLVLPDPNDARPRLMTGPTPKNIYFLINVQLFILTILQFFSIGLVHFSHQNWNSQKFLFNCHIIMPFVQMKKAVSHCIKQIANAFVHPCKWLCTVLSFFLHYQLLLSCQSKCFVMGIYQIVSLPKTFRL